jgi:putative ABC transport system substrate-binding protein
MKRRTFIAGLGGAAAWPLAARAQQGERLRRVGMFMLFDENDPPGRTFVSAFIQALAGFGWTDGRNVRMDLRWGGSDTNRIRALAEELVGLQPDIILAHGTPATVALQGRTRTIPIVFVSVADPVASGIVARLDRPSGNITGFANYEASLGGKWVELLSEIAPGLKRAAIMFNPDTAPVSSFVPSFETAARLLKVVPITAPVHSDLEIETAIITLGREPGGGLVVGPDVFTDVHRAPIISAADPAFPATPSIIANLQAAASALDRQLIIVNAGTDSDLETAFARFSQQYVGAVLVSANTFYNRHVEKLAELAARHLLPAIFPQREFALAGGLMSYGSSSGYMYHQAGVYIGRILKGEKPADLPVEQPTKVELVINLKTARTLGLTIPETLLATADEVIQ